MRIATLAAALLLAAPAALAAQRAPSPSEAAVRAAVDSFSTALQRGDSLAALRMLHPDVVVYESGEAENLAEYRSHHLAADIAYLKEVRSTTTRDRVTVAGGMALYTREYRSRGTWRGRAIDSAGTETLVLTRVPQGWRIRHIHWSSRN